MARKFKDEVDLTPNLDSEVDSSLEADEEAIVFSEAGAMLADQCSRQHDSAILNHIMQKFHIHDQRLAEDLKQEVFYRFSRYVQGHGIDSIRRPKSYLIKMADNICYDHFEKAKRSPAISHIPEELISNLGEDDITRWHNKSALQAALKTLSSQEREMVQLRFFEGWTYGKMAKRYKKCEVAISYNVKRILAKLRKELQEPDA